MGIPKGEGRKEQRQYLKHDDWEFPQINVDTKL